MFKIFSCEISKKSKGSRQVHRHDLRELLEIFSRMVDYYIRPNLKDLLIYEIFEKISDGVQHLEVGLIEISHKATKKISLA